jgi:hypothetical protein
MNAPKENPPVFIVVPPLLADLIGQLADRMAAATGEPLGACRRLVEVSCLTQGSRIVQGEIAAIENQAGRNGWPKGGA